MLTLPANPSHVRPLSDADAERLRQTHTSLWSNPTQECVTCRSRGTFKARERGEIVEYKCDCLQQWLLHRYLLNAGIGLRYQRVSWIDLDQQVPQAVQQAIMEYAEEADHYVIAGLGMILWGDKGTGKTLLATLLLKTLLAAGHDGYFTQFNEMIDAYTDTWRNNDEKRWFTRRMRNATLLVVDDIGKEHKGRVDMVESMFDQVIRARVANAKPTIITTNYTPDQMLSGYGGGVMSLLAESCFDHHVTGPDFRPRLRERSLQDARDGVVRPITLA